MSRQASGLPRFSLAALASAAARCVCRRRWRSSSKAGSEPLRAAWPVQSPGLSAAGSFHRPRVGLLASGRRPVRHGLWGRLFGDRYKSVLVEGEGHYYETLVNYIHLNPARAHLVNPEKGGGIRDYAWSSVAGGYALPPAKRAKWLAAGKGLGAMGLPDTVAGRRRYVERLNRIMVEEGLERAGVPPIREEVDRRCSHLRRGWYWGSQEFGERMLRLGNKILKSKRHRSYKGSGENRAHGEQEAQRLLKQGLEAAGLAKRDLAKLPGSDLRKVAVARQIWDRTTVSMNWVSEQLAMKSAANASTQIRRMKKMKNPTKSLPAALCSWISQS